MAVRARRSQRRARASEPASGAARVVRALRRSELASEDRTSMRASERSETGPQGAWHLGIDFQFR